MNTFDIIIPVKDGETRALLEAVLKDLADGRRVMFDDPNLDPDEPMPPHPNTAQAKAAIQEAFQHPLVGRQKFLYATIKKAQEYADEAEYQDGTSYWDSDFDDGQAGDDQMLMDFTWYLMVVYDMER